MEDLGRRSEKVVLLIIVAVVTAFSIPYILRLVDQLGHNIPSIDHPSDYIKGVLAAMVLYIPLFMAPLDSEDRKNLLLLWTAKVLVSLGAMLFYEANYGLDAYYYFEGSQKYYCDFSKVGFGNSTDNMVALLWTVEHEIIHTASFHAMKIACSFLGLIGLFLFYRGISKYVEHIPPRFLLMIGLFPSVLFWSSILGKDPINLFGICLTFYGMLRLFTKRNPVYLLLVVSGLALIAMIRMWMIPILLLPFFLGMVLRIKSKFIRNIIATVMVVGLFYGIQKAAVKFGLDDVDQTAKNLGAISRAWQRGGSSGSMPVINTPAEALAFLPIGMFTAVFRPLPGEVMNPFGFIAGLENVGILYLLYLSFRKVRKETFKDPLVIWLGSYVIFWSMLYAFLSPQNLGAAVRFRLQILPMLITLFVYLAFFKQPTDDPDSI